jgi:hypothetical protein
MAISRRSTLFEILHYLSCVNMMHGLIPVEKQTDCRQQHNDDPDSGEGNRRGIKIGCSRIAKYI